MPGTRLPHGQYGQRVVAEDLDRPGAAKPSSANPGPGAEDLVDGAVHVHHRSPMRMVSTSFLGRPRSGPVAFSECPDPRLVHARPDPGAGRRHRRGRPARPDARASRPAPSGSTRWCWPSAWTRRRRPATGVVGRRVRHATAAALAALAGRCDVVTFDHELVDLDERRPRSSRGRGRRPARRRRPSRWRSTSRRCAGAWPGPASRSRRSPTLAGRRPEALGAVERFAATTAGRSS